MKKLSAKLTKERVRLIKKRMRRIKRNQRGREVVQQSNSPRR